MTNESTFGRRQLGICDELIQFCIELAKSACQLGWQSDCRVDGWMCHIKNPSVQLGHQVDHFAAIGGENINMLAVHPRNQPFQAQAPQIVAHPHLRWGRCRRVTVPTSYEGDRQ